MKYSEIIQELESLSSPEDVEGMARFGINPQKTYAVRIPELRRIAGQWVKTINWHYNSGRRVTEKPGY